MKRLATLALILVTSGAYADLTPVNTLGEWSSSPSLSLQGVINARGNTLVDIQSDADQLDADGLWTATGTVSSGMVVEVAGYAPNNAFGIYNAANPSQRTTIFAGSAAAGASFSLVSPYSTFGFYLQNTQAGFTWFSDNTLNAGGGRDHMVAYQGKGQTLTLGGAAGSFVWDSNAYLLGWEDLNLGDWDYNDMVVVVRDVSPVPDTTTTLSLLGLATGLLVWFRRRTA